MKNGDLFIVDRLKVKDIRTLFQTTDSLLRQEIMKVRGYQVAPAELEGHLLMHPDVLDACVVPVPDEYSGEVPLAYVVLSDPALRRVVGNPSAGDELKGVIAKVRFLL